MLRRYHAEVTRAALGGVISPADLRTVIRANLHQDRLSGQIGHPEYHFDDSAFAAGEAYIEAQRRLAVEAVVHRRDRSAALEAFGRLLHARQDFYAHSNWVRLWVERQGGLEQCRADEVEICARPLDWAELCSGTASPGLVVLSMLPLVGRLVKRFYLPPTTHEAMNLDHPGRGPLFPFALVAAAKHSWLEFEALVEAIEAAGRPEAVDDLLHSPPQALKSPLSLE